MTKIVIPDTPEVARLRAENARLRVALRPFADAYEAALAWSKTRAGQHAVPHYVARRDLPEEAFTAARAALSGPAPGEGE